MLLAASASAQCVGLPPGQRSFIKFAGNCPATCDSVFVAETALPVPSPDYAACEARVLLANADNSPNRLRNCYTRNGATSHLFLSNAFVDTYTIAGPPGTDGQPVNATVRMRTVGTLTWGYHGVVNGLPAYTGSSNVGAIIGTWNPDTSPTVQEQFRVNFFDPAFVADFDTGGGVATGTQPLFPFDIECGGTLTRTVGVPFDLAFRLKTDGTGAGNISRNPSPADSDYIVSTIRWSLPPGYSITSVRGWTDPDAPACDPDFNADGSVDQNDIDSLVNVIAGGANPGGLDPDFNHDGVNDQDDVDDLINVVAGGACP
jgi:hypothetical protein